MKKILILANNDVGLFKFRKELIEELLKDNEVFISLPNGNLVEPLKNMGCHFIDTPVDRRGINPKKDIQLLKKYISIMKEIQPDIVLTYTIKPNIYGGWICSKLNIPYLVNITGLGTAVENEGLLQKITVFLYKLSMKKAQCVFFQNQENMDFFNQHHIKLLKKQLIPGSGVNINYFKPLSYPNDKTIEFVFIARVMKQKGIDQYLEVAKYIRNKYPQTRFHICGFCEDEYRSVLKELEEQGVIQYHGMIMDVREILKITHCTIHPTYYPEGMSNVLLESCACARPIITTNRSGCKEVIDDKINGFIIQQQDSKSLIEAIEEFLSMPNKRRKEMGLASREKVKQEFNREIVIDKYMKECRLEKLTTNNINGYKRVIKSASTRNAILNVLRFVPSPVMLQLQYHIKFGRKLNLKDPKRFTEIIQLYKLYYKEPLMHQCVDKFLVRDFVKSKGLDHILVRLIAKYDSIEAVEWEKLPKQFVIKTTNGGGGLNVVVCNDKDEFNKENIKEKLKCNRIKQNTGGREWAYYGLNPGIVIEELLQNAVHPENGITDYKFFCFSGEPKYVVVDVDRYINHKRNFYDLEWNNLNIGSDCSNGKSDITKPVNFEEMLKIACILSEDFPYVRVDLYNIEGKIYFGELTFYPWSGYVQFDPDEFDYVLGRQFRDFRNIGKKSTRKELF